MGPCSGLSHCHVVACRPALVMLAGSGRAGSTNAGGGGNRLTPGLPSPTVPPSEWLTSDTHTALVQRKTPTDSLGSLGVLASWGTRTPGTLQMEVGPGTIVTMYYSVRLDSGQIVDSSEGRDPLVVHFGQGQIIPGLERELAGLQSGFQPSPGRRDPDFFSDRTECAVHRKRPAIPPDRAPCPSA
jgi:hypothetical protein